MTDADRMNDARQLVASWTYDTDERQALGELLDALGLDITEPDIIATDDYNPLSDPTIDWKCQTCRRLITVADAYVVLRRGEGNIAYHADCEPS